MKLKWFVQHEPVMLGGILSGIGVFFGVRYGSHSTAALQGSLGLGSASFVSFLSRFVGPSAVSDVQGIANDVASLRDQIGPLPKKGGIMSVTEALGKTVVEKRQEIAAIGEAIKADIEDLWNHKAQASFDPPKLTTGPTADTAPTGGQVTIHQDPASKSGASVPMTVNKPTTESGTLTAWEPPQGGTQAASVPGNTVAEPVSEAPTPAADAVAELAALVP